MAPPELDHVIVAGPSLPVLRAELEARTGVRAVAGGRHDGQGTHNALVGFGAGRYLELLAIDPEAGAERPGTATPDPDAPGGRFLDDIAYLAAPALHGWCLRPTGDADAFAARVRAAGLAARRLPMARTRPDGVRLAWELVFVDGHPFGGLVPFAIDWRGSPHPSAALAPDLAFEELRLEHPDAAALRALLEALGGVPAGVTIAVGAAPRLVARWRGPRGLDAWSGRGAP